MTQIKTEGNTRQNSSQKAKIVNLWINTGLNYNKQNALILKSIYKIKTKR